eukprot:jgi/Mesvir1/13870/Mv16010-RA.1
MAEGLRSCRSVFASPRRYQEAEQLLTQGVRLVHNPVLDKLLHDGRVGLVGADCRYYPGRFNYSWRPDPEYQPFATKWLRGRKQENENESKRARPRGTLELYERQALQLGCTQSMKALARIHLFGAGLESAPAESNLSHSNGPSELRWALPLQWALHWIGPNPTNTLGPVALDPAKGLAWARCCVKQHKDRTQPPLDRKRDRRGVMLQRATSEPPRDLGVAGCLNMISAAYCHGLAGLDVDLDKARCGGCVPQQRGASTLSRSPTWRSTLWMGRAKQRGKGMCTWRNRWICSAWRRAT